MPQNIYIFVLNQLWRVMQKPIQTLIEHVFNEGTDAYLPHVTVNCVVFGYQHPSLKVLVFRLPGLDSWSLPGGYVKREEHIDDAAYRNLRMSGIHQVFLKQIQTFGDPFRVPPLSEVMDIDFPVNKEIMRWVSQRFVTIVYYGLVDLTTIQQSRGELLPESHWMDVHQPEKMIQDHGSIVKETRKLLVNELLQYPVAQNLLPGSFTMNEYRGVFEAILNRPIDRGTFRRKMMKLDHLEQVDRRQDALGRPSHLFRFKQEQYQSYLAEETKFGF